MMKLYSFITVKNQIYLQSIDNRSKKLETFMLFSSSGFFSFLSRLDRELGSLLTLLLLELSAEVFPETNEPVDKG